MSEAPDKESKTEEATEKKVQDSLEKGNIPVSREVSILASILGMLLILAFVVRQRASSLTRELAHFIDDPGGRSIDNGADATLLLQGLAFEAGRFLLPMVLILAAAGVAASIFQNVPRVVLDRIEPKWSRVSPAGGWNRLFGMQGLVEFGKSSIKFLAMVGICVFLLRSERHGIVMAMFSDPTLLPEQILVIAMRLVSAVSIATIVIVAADLVWARVRWRQDLRMTRQEVKDEFKQAEGDPLVKARLRSLAQDRARKRMMTAIPRATVVIANPTHYAIALRYVPDEGGAPLVLAKGQDLIALKIREVAEEHGIPVIEDKALARSMYDAVEVDRMIPPDFYRAIAQILYFIYTRDKSHVREENALRDPEKRK